MDVGFIFLCGLIYRLKDLFFKRKALCIVINGSVCDSLMPGVHACQLALSSVEPWPSPVTGELGHLPPLPVFLSTSVLKKTNCLGVLAQAWDLSLQKVETKGLRD